jgi:hypothetical protein
VSASSREYAIPPVAPKQEPESCGTNWRLMLLRVKQVGFQMLEVPSEQRSA